jgi:tetratricopeptide (TPR) repeat protein
LWWTGRNEDAGKYFRQAVQIQPDYALGWSGLAEYYAEGALDGYLDPRVVLPQGEAAARKAIELDDTLPKAHADLAGSMFLNHRDGAAALKEITHATELDPEEWEPYSCDCSSVYACSRVLNLAIGTMKCFRFNNM